MTAPGAAQRGNKQRRKRSGHKGAATGAPCRSAVGPDLRGSGSGWCEGLARLLGAPVRDEEDDSDQDGATPNGRGILSRETAAPGKESQRGSACLVGGSFRLGTPKGLTILFPIKSLIGTTGLSTGSGGILRKRRDFARAKPAPAR